MTARKQKAGPFKYKPPQKIVPLNPDKPLAPQHVPALRAFDRRMPGQGMLDLAGDGEFTIVYADGEPDGDD